MKQRNFPESITIIKQVIGESNRNMAVGTSSLSSRRPPQDFYFDIDVSPRPDRNVSAGHSNQVKNRLRAFELASRVLRDIPDIEYDTMVPVDATNSRYSPDLHPSRRFDGTTSDHYRAKSSSVSLDFGNNSDSRVLKVRRDNLRRESMSACDPSRGWGDLTYHQSFKALLASGPKSTPR